MKPAKGTEAADDLISYGHICEWGALLEQLPDSSLSSRDCVARSGSGDVSVEYLCMLAVRDHDLRLNGVIQASECVQSDSSARKLRVLAGDGQFSNQLQISHRSHTNERSTSTKIHTFVVGNTKFVVFCPFLIPQGISAASPRNGAMSPV